MRDVAIISLYLSLCNKFFLSLVVYMQLSLIQDRHLTLLLSISPWSDSCFSHDCMVAWSILSKKYQEYWKQWLFPLDQKFHINIPGLYTFIIWKLDHALSSCIVEMVYVVKVVKIVCSLYSIMPAPQSQTSLWSSGNLRLALSLDSEKFQS